MRIGNAAADHVQMDVFGEVIVTIHSLFVLKGELQPEVWELVQFLAEYVMGNWGRKDRGVWEVRGELQHFVYLQGPVLGRAGPRRVHGRRHG